MREYKDELKTSGINVHYRFLSDNGKSYTEKGYRFSINSKRRVANQLYDGTTIGVNNDNN